MNKPKIIFFGLAAFLLGCGGGRSSSGSSPVTPPSSDIISADRRTLWNPGLNAVGGIPVRTTLYTTLSPSGGDDTALIQAALDSCPSGQVVKLNAGTFNISGSGLNFQTSGITLRGSGTGTAGSGQGGTRLVKADNATNLLYGILYMGNTLPIYQSIDLAADAVKGTQTVTLASAPSPAITVGELVLVDHNTDNDPSVVWNHNQDPPGGGSRRWFCRQDRSLSQILEVTAVNGTTLTFATPFHTTFKTAYGAQLSRYGSGAPQPFLNHSGVEDLYLEGGRGGDYHGNIPVTMAAYCWVKNVESNHSIGTAVGLYSTYRCELRDSYLHTSDDPNPGGGGYLSGISAGGSDNLIENNIMWSGNKMIVMRASGGGNVVGYNYMEDGYGSGYPEIPEIGLNASHFTTPHMELLEGNRAFNVDGDSFWGNSIQITVFRNHFTGRRGAYGPLATYVYTDSSGGSYPYEDLWMRRMASLNVYQYGYNFVGNVLGTEDMALLSFSNATFTTVQTAFVYEATAEDNATVPMWQLGYDGENPGAPYDPQVPATTLRSGNFDWFTQTVRWHGVGGAAGSGTPVPIPDSLYLSSKPAFFGTLAWPWVDPLGTTKTATLPAKARFDAMATH